MQVVILCGGQGTRAYPYTQTLPKALMEINGVAIVEQVMRIYARRGFTDFILSCGYLKEHVVDYFSHARADWRVRCEDTGDDADTGDRIFRLRHLITGAFHATYCDGLGDVDLDALMAFHARQSTLGTVTGAALRSQYGLVNTDPHDRVTAFVEKPIIPSLWVNAGFFVFEPEVFDFWQGHNLERDVLPALAARSELGLYRHHGFWRSMDTYKDQQELGQLWAPYAERMTAEPAAPAAVLAASGED